MQLKYFDIFLVVAQNIHCEYPQSMFWIKNKKNGIPLYTPVSLFKSGVQQGIHCMNMFA